MKVVDPPVWADCLAEAREYAKEHDGLSNQLVISLSNRCDMTPRAFRRKFKLTKDAEYPTSRRWQLDVRRRAMVVQYGSVTQAAAHDTDAPDARSKWTWLRSWRGISLAERLGMTRRAGEKAMRSKQVYATYLAEFINEVWQLDTHFPKLATVELLAWEALSRAERRSTPKPRLWVFVGIDDR